VIFEFSVGFHAYIKIVRNLILPRIKNFPDIRPLLKINHDSHNSWNPVQPRYYRNLCEIITDSTYKPLVKKCNDDRQVLFDSGNGRHSRLSLLIVSIVMSRNHGINEVKKGVAEPKRYW